MAPVPWFRVVASAQSGWPLIAASRRCPRFESDGQKLRVDRFLTLVVCFPMVRPREHVRSCRSASRFLSTVSGSFPTTLSLPDQMGSLMLKPPSKRLLGAGIFLAIVAAIPAAVWFSLTYEPSYYRDMVRLPHDQREVRAKHFVAQSLQLRNDIVNEPTWEAVFSDQEVNAWLAEDLVTHFADQLPPEVHDPRVLFEMDRVILAFQLDKGGVQSVITVVARPRIPDGQHGRADPREDPRRDPSRSRRQRPGSDHRACTAPRGRCPVERRDGYPVVVMRYTPSLSREDVQLEEVEIRSGQIRLAGRSDRTRGAFTIPRLPSRRVLQSTFPRRNLHVEPAVQSGPEQDRSTSPTS